MVDASGSVGKDNWKLVQNFLKAFTDQFTISTDNVQVCAPSYLVVFYCKSYDSVSPIS